MDLDDRDGVNPDIFCVTSYDTVTTYEAIRRSYEVLTRYKWECVVFDEGQIIHNIYTDVTLACNVRKGIKRKEKGLRYTSFSFFLLLLLINFVNYYFNYQKRLYNPRRLLFIDVPIQKDLREMWSLFDFFLPGEGWANYQRFNWSSLILSRGLDIQALLQYKNTLYIIVRWC